MLAINKNKHLKKVWPLLSGIAPWIIIAGLLASGLLIKPQPDGNTVLPSVIETQDRFYGVDVPAPGQIWFVGNDGKIVRSSDDGKSWRRQNSGTGYHLQDISAWSEQQAVAVGNDGVVLQTQDGGKHWRQVQVPLSEVFNKLIRVRTFAAGKAIAVGAMGSVLLSDDYGTSWKRIATEEDVSWNDVTVNGENIWLVGEFGFISTSSDSGENWRKLSSTVDSSLTGIAFSDDLRGVAVGLDGVLLHTFDAGQSWSQIEKVTETHLFSVLAHDAGWFVVGDKGVVLTANKAAEQWQVISLGEHDLSWHTDIEISEGGVYLAGANVGLWRLGKWQKF